LVACDCGDFEGRDSKAAGKLTCSKTNQTFTHIINPRIALVVYLFDCVSFPVLLFQVLILTDLTNSGPCIVKGFNFRLILRSNHM